MTVARLMHRGAGLPCPVHGPVVDVIRAGSWPECTYHCTRCLAAAAREKASSPHVRVEDTETVAALRVPPLAA